MKQKTGERTPILVLFVTPSLSTLLSEDQSFLKHLLDRVFSTLEIGQEFDLLAAVVDSIPYPPRAHLEAIGADMPSKHGLGSEGISLLVAETQRAAPDLWSDRQESQERQSMDIQQRSTVSFSFEPSYKWRKSNSETYPPMAYTSQLLELPLANTMFHNAQTSTMFAQRWVVTQNGDNSEFNRIKQTSLTQQTLDLPNFGRFNELSITLPLRPITVPRRVTSAMGNIVRRIQAGENPGDDSPASEELEKDIHSYFKRSDAAEKKLDVWALVTPQENWISQPQSTRERTIVSQIEAGARLHKVLSGGGGWGVKQGLLSLDPDSTYCRANQASQLMVEDGGDFEAEKRAVLGELVKPGDVIQFYVGVSDARDHEPMRGPTRTQVLYNPGGSLRTIIVGTIPSTMDAMPQIPTLEGQKEGSSPHMLVHNHFGALSEQGMSLKVTTRSTHDPEKTTSIGVQRTGTVVQTKLDVPYSRFGWLPAHPVFHKALADGKELINFKSSRSMKRSPISNPISPSESQLPTTNEANNPVTLLEGAARPFNQSLSKGRKSKRSSRNQKPEVQMKPPARFRRLRFTLRKHLSGPIEPANPSIPAITQRTSLLRSRKPAKLFTQSLVGRPASGSESAALDPPGRNDASKISTPESAAEPAPRFTITRFTIWDEAEKERIAKDVKEDEDVAESQKERLAKDVKEDKDVAESQKERLAKDVKEDKDVAESQKEIEPAPELPVRRITVDSSNGPYIRKFRVDKEPRPRRVVFNVTKKGAGPGVR